MSTPITKTDRLIKDLNDVNKLINRIRYETDLNRYGTEDFWTAKIEEAGTGDCDDYALTKRRLLMRLGYDWECLQPAICKINRGQDGHLVLLVKTDDGFYILDNNYDTLGKYPGRDYEWIYRLDGARGWVNFKA